MYIGYIFCLFGLFVCSFILIGYAMTNYRPCIYAKHLVYLLLVGNSSHAGNLWLGLPRNTENVQNLFRSLSSDLIKFVWTMYTTSPDQTCSPWTFVTAWAILVWVMQSVPCTALLDWVTEAFLLDSGLSASAFVLPAVPHLKSPIAPLGIC